MAGGDHDRTFDQTPTWAVAFVCAVIIVLSILLEEILHSIGKVFKKKRKRALYEALENIKNELMILGFISLLLTFGKNYFTRICIPLHIANTMLPCPHRQESHEPAEAENQSGGGAGHRNLLMHEHRFLAADSLAQGCNHGHVPLISLHGLHQLHIFIFFLAIFHVAYSCMTMTLGRLKTREWKVWEKEIMEEEDLLNDPQRVRLAHQTSFVRDHNSFWTKTAASFYFVCFFRQFFRSVTKADYLTMRHGFITVHHLSSGSKFNFQKYIKRSLEDDFKTVVGTSPLLWAMVVLFLLYNVHGWHAMYWVSIFPLIVILAIGTKLQAIITKMALEIKERHAVVQGIPLVQVSDRHFWFAWPDLILYLIHFVLFQNAFEITYFLWTWYEFGLRSCFHEDFNIAVGRITLGVGALFLCSYATLPLYALVTQMGSHMKMSVFDERISSGLQQWLKKALDKTNEGSSRGRRRSATRTLGGGG